MSVATNEPAVGPVDEPTAPVVKVPLRERAKRSAKLVRKHAEVHALQVAEQYLRQRSFRLIVIQCAGAYLAFRGMELYSHRVAYLILGVGIILAAERQ